MAKKQPAETGEVKARVLVDCAHGKVNDVVTFASASEAQAAGADIDSDSAAVEYAESLKRRKQNPTS